MSQPSDREIYPHLEFCYITSMLFNTESALVSAQWMIKLFEKYQGREIDINPHRPLNHLQNIILHGAALSRYFWPARAGHEYRAAKLRAVFKMDDASPLKSRELRNQLEHFDEKLDDYLKEPICGHFFPNHFGPDYDGGGVPQHNFRAYYTDIGVFEILGQRFEIEPIVNEIIRIHDLLLEFEKAGMRFPQSKSV